jgi:L-aminopeptidase/D-esterase-like protein
MTEPAPAAGPTNSLSDIAGIKVGHAQKVGDGWLTGTTVVLAPPGGAIAGVDVRGGGPGTRETDLLNPLNNNSAIHAVLLTGGSAFGLAAADGVMRALEADGIGYQVGDLGVIVPIVPGAVIFDLGRGGDQSLRPGPDLGAAAYAAASDGPVEQGVVGAGTGAKAGGLKGGVGTASLVLADGSTVAALVVVNCVGSTVDLATGELYAERFCLLGELGVTARPSAAELAEAKELAELAGPMHGPLATTLVVVATDVALTKAQCAKVAGIGHDGLARAIRPVHTMFDGDSIFTMATATRPAPDPFQLHALLEAAGDCVTRAVGRAMVAATSVSTPAGQIRSYRDAFASAFA